MEALASDEEIDQEYRQSIEIVQEKLGINRTSDDILHLTFSPFLPLALSPFPFQLLPIRCPSDSG